jgi:F0F1-type ATP synthase assembly protein I
VDPVTDQPLPPNHGQKPKNAWKQYGEYSQIALILPAAILAGLILGAVLDRWLHTTWLTVAGLLLGAGVGFYQLARGLMKVSKDT